jgi:glycosyltransferase involved in cell wall biosynthesis
MVAVSNTVLTKSLELCPSLADRATVIPIGVKVPAMLPSRSAVRPGKLRLIYHGILKQHQKRVLDLPLIVAAALDLGIPVELTIAGAGPDEEALRAAAQPLVDRGAIRFTGVIDHDALGPLLEEHLMYLLPSEFEGMPNALLEAMAHACVPVVSRMSSGISDVIRDGENGYLAPCGDIGGFARCLLDFWNSGLRQQDMAEAAYKTIATGVYTVDAMVNSYIQAFRTAARQSFVRPRGLLSPPPVTVDGVSIFPVPLIHCEPEVGPFPSAEDAEDFHRERRRMSPASGRELTAIVALPLWARNGISIFAEDLVRGLRKEGIAAKILLTEENTPLVHVDEPRMPRPTDIPVEELSVKGPETWGRRWGAMHRYLLQHTPCVYMPSFDWRHSCIIPQLPDDVLAVGLIHSPDALYFDYVRRLGSYCNAIVATDRSTESKLHTAFPELTSRLVTIPLRMDLPDLYPERPRNSGQLKVLVGRPANVDTGKLATILASHHIPVEFTSAPETEEPTRTAWLSLYSSHDIFLTSVQHGAPANNVWEAMARGCVPVLAGGDIPANVSEGQTGFCVSSDADREVAAILVRLATDRALLNTISRSTFGQATRRIPRLTDTIDDYKDLFERMRFDLANKTYRRPRGPIQPPPARIGGVDIFPLTANYHAKGVGPFPSRRNCLDYRQELRGGRRPTNR